MGLIYGRKKMHAGRPKKARRREPDKVRTTVGGKQRLSKDQISSSFELTSNTPIATSVVSGIEDGFASASNFVISGTNVVSTLSGTYVDSAPAATSTASGVGSTSNTTTGYVSQFMAHKDLGVDVTTL
ncbi:hypothetical protein ACH5RR_006715 [Cinchona calisaya]|uniref:Uncharacterized protein n=1 Tax=Cinchona calisaya TaxID=153742 RepID=A0ABD3AQ84_9GENT